MVVEGAKLDEVDVFIARGPQGGWNFEVVTLQLLYIFPFPPLFEWHARIYFWQHGSSYGEARDLASHL